MPKEVNNLSSLDAIAVEVADEEAAAVLPLPPVVLPPPEEVVDHSLSRDLNYTADAATALTGEAVNNHIEAAAIDTAVPAINSTVNNSHSNRRETANTAPAKKPAKTYCSHPSCSNLAIKKGLCYRHGAKQLLPPKPTCKVPNCTNQVQRGGVCCKHGAKVKRCKAEGCNKNAVKKGLCSKHGRLEGVVEEKICKVEGCTNRVLKRGKKSSATGSKSKNEVGGDNNEGSTVTEEEEKEEEYCKRHAVKKVDEEGHVLCSERWCRNKVGHDQSGGEGDEKQPCCEKGDDAVPLCTKHCLSSHHVDCGEECTSSVHDHEHHHHHNDGGEKKRGEAKAVNIEKEGDDHQKGEEPVEKELGKCAHDHDHGHHHHHDHEDKSKDDESNVAAEKAVVRPKKPLNAYMRYIAEVRGELAKEFPDLSSKELSVKLGEKWKALNEDDKKKYVDEAKADMAKFREQYGNDAFKPKPKPKPKNVPKTKPRTAETMKDTIESYDFINKLVSMVNDSSISRFIQWSVPTPSEGKSSGKNVGIVLVLDPKGLQDNVLGKYFKHSQYSSFQRQMNYFGFKKKMLNEKGTMNPCYYVHDELGKDPSSILSLKRRPKGDKEAGAKDAAKVDGSSGEKRKEATSSESDAPPPKKRTRRKCNVPDCTNQAKSGGICIRHGAKQPERKNRRICSKEDCTNIAQKAGVCRAHAERCSKEGCENRAKKGDTCLKHVSSSRKRHRSKEKDEGAHDHSHSHDHGDEENPAKAHKKKATDTPKKRMCKSEGCEKKPVRKGVCNDHGGKQHCKAEGCDNVAKEGGVCRKHGAKAKTCSHEGCGNVVRQGGKCVRHGARVTASMICSVDDCTSRAQKGGVCRKHGAPARLCKVEGCTFHAQNHGVCFRHGAEQKRCSSEGCNNFAINGGVCRRHGAKLKECSAEGCTNRAASKGVCRKHGAQVKICSAEDCNNQARKGGVCEKHGATVRKRKLCTVDGCTTRAVNGGVCIKHGAKVKQCEKEDCNNNALKGGRCYRHREGKEAVRKKSATTATMVTV